MKKNIFLLVVILLGLSVFAGDADAEMIDVVHLKNGSVIKGLIIETIPNESIKIETADGSIFVYEMSEVEKMTKVRKENKIPKESVELKNRAISTFLAVGTGFFSLNGSGQLYNGEPGKALGFFAIGFLSAYMAVTTEEPIYYLPVLVNYGYAIYDANVSAKKINEKRLQRYEQSNASTLLQYIPHEGLMASYSYRF